MSEKRNNSGGITFIDVLQVAFIVLKLLHVIEWSWIWVLSPMWISFILIGASSIFVVYREYKRSKRNGS